MQSKNYNTGWLVPIREVSLGYKVGLGKEPKKDS